VPHIASGRKGWPHTMTHDVTNLNTFQTNKDQFLGRIIAEAAAQIARGAHLKKEKEDKQKEKSKDKSDDTLRQE
jgi:hypothetical protein